MEWFPFDKPTSAVTFHQLHFHLFDKQFGFMKLHISTWTILIIFGFTDWASSSSQAPGIIQILIKYRLEANEQSENIQLHSKIKEKSRHEIMLYEGIQTMKPISTDESVLETSFSFEINNISESLFYSGSLTLQNFNEIKKYHFHLTAFQYNFKNANPQNKDHVIPMTFYSHDIEKELEVLITGKCKKNYYPRYKCTVLCIDTENTEECNANGIKICRKGYYLNNETQRCDIDLCSYNDEVCKNNGKCINQLQGFKCICTPSFAGLHCQNKIDLCTKYTCPNGTRCEIENEKIVCRANSQKAIMLSSKDSLLKLISVHTVTAIIGFIIIFIITVGVTMWACRRPYERKSRSMETSLNSNHSYYNCSSICKLSKSPYLDQHIHQCLCVRNPINSNQLYHSLKQPANRLITNYNRAHSDLMISNVGRNYSLTLDSKFENLPLPPPIEYNDDEEDTLIL